MKTAVIGLPVPPPGMTWDDWQGTPEWAVRLREQLRVKIEGEVLQTEIVCRDLEEFRAHEGWRLLTGADGKPFKSFRELCEHPKPNGLGVPFTRIEPLWKRARSAKTLRPHGGDRKPEATLLDNQVASGGESYGTDPDYLIARVKRDAPDVFERAMAGEFTSARSAAIAAGVPVSDPDKRRVYLPASPQVAARRLVERFGERWCAELAGYIVAASDGAQGGAP
jgi:hypothetical protein